MKTAHYSIRALGVTVFACMVVACMVVACALGCHSARYAEQGAVLGGLTGAITGAALGDRSGEAGAGAVIGGAVGALAGAAMGDSIDEEAARNRAMIEQQMGRQMAGAVTTADVMAMVQAQLSESVIITHIRTNGVAQRPSVEDLIMLRNQGVPDGVIQALQQTPPPQPPAAAVAAPAPRPVIVEEHYYGSPPVWPYWGMHRHPVYRRQPGISWGVTFGN